MKNLKKKMRKQNGFTLIEMLIVVAIIAILVAVSIPVVNNALEKTRVATDAANERAAKAAAEIYYLTEQVDWENDSEPGRHDRAYYWYDASSGKLVPFSSSPAGYGKCNLHKDQLIYVVIFNTGEIEITWNGDPDNCHNGVVD